MAFLSTVLLLAGIVSGILIAIFVGHGLAAHNATFYLYAVGAGAVAAVLIFLYSLAARRADGAGASH